MRQSKPITDDGRLIGVAARDDNGWFFIAIDPRTARLDRARFTDPEAAGRAARGALLHTAVHTVIAAPAAA
jgi:hypothetical protein